MVQHLTLRGREERSRTVRALRGVAFDAACVPQPLHPSFSVTPLLQMPEEESLA
jgi:hypothetical protein